MKPKVRGFGGSRSARAKVIALTLLAIAVSAVVMDRVAVSELRSVAHGAGVDASARNIAITIAVIAVCFAAFMALVMRKVIFRALRGLDDVIRRRREGDRSARLGWTRRDEFGALGRNFDAMADESDEHERQLAESERKLAEAQRVARLGSWEWIRETNSFIGSDEMLRLLAIKPRPEYAEAQYDTAVSYVHPEDLERVQNIVRDSARAGKPFSFEFRLVGRDDDVRYMYARGEPELDDEGVVRIVGTHHDITELKRLEQIKNELEAQLAHKQRMESVGQLAGGIAHDFNNLLAVIINYASLVRDDLHADHPARKDIDEISRAADLAASLTRQLLIFSRRDAAQPRALDVNHVIAETEKLLRRTLGETSSSCWTAPAASRVCSPTPARSSRCWSTWPSTHATQCRTAVASRFAPRRSRPRATAPGPKRSVTCE